MTSRKNDLDEKSLHLRRQVFRALKAANKGHVGSALSMIEIFRVLYEDVARHDPAHPEWEGRDHIVLSKGHGCLGLYVVLVDQGYIDPSILDTFCERGSPLGGHPEREMHLGIEASTGALGHGLPLAVGMALGHKKRGDGARVFVVVGDGELNEGSNWEALLMAAKHKLSNLTVLIDHNNDQISGTLDEVLPMAPLAAKFEAFGALTAEINGHSRGQLRETLERLSTRKSGPPAVVICHTIKGKGVAEAERNPKWHYMRGFDAKMLEKIDVELTVAG